jgi:hypothetical protein
MTSTPLPGAAMTALGMPVPDSAFARRADELIVDVAPAFLVNHSIRSYAWAVELRGMTSSSSTPRSCT